MRFFGGYRIPGTRFYIGASTDGRSFFTALGWWIIILFLLWVIFGTH